MSRKLKFKTVYKEKDGQRIDIPALKGRDGVEDGAFDSLKTEIVDHEDRITALENSPAPPGGVTGQTPVDATLTIEGAAADAKQTGLLIEAERAARQGDAAALRTAIEGEQQARGQAISAETEARTQAITAEAEARELALAAESEAREQALEEIRGVYVTKIVNEYGTEYERDQEDNSTVIVSSQEERIATLEEAAEEQGGQVSTLEAAVQALQGRKNFHVENFTGNVALTTGDVASGNTWTVNCTGTPTYLVALHRAWPTNNWNNSAMVNLQRVTLNGKQVKMEFTTSSTQTYALGVAILCE